MQWEAKSKTMDNWMALPREKREHATTVFGIWQLEGWCVAILMFSGFFSRKSVT